MSREEVQAKGDNTRSDNELTLKRGAIYDTLIVMQISGETRYVT